MPIQFVITIDCRFTVLTLSSVRFTHRRAQKVSFGFGFAFITRILYHKTRGSKRGWQDLSSVLTKLGNVRKAEKKYGEAGAYYREALEMDRTLAKEALRELSN